MNDIDRIKSFDYGLARYFAIGYYRGYAHGDGDTTYPTASSDAERAAWKAGYDAGVADYSAEG